MIWLLLHQDEFEQLLAFLALLVIAVSAVTVACVKASQRLDQMFEEMLQSSRSAFINDLTRDSGTAPRRAHNP